MNKEALKGLAAERNVVHVSLSASSTGLCSTTC